MTLTIATLAPYHAGQRVLITTDRGAALTGTVLRCNGAEALVAVGGRELAFQQHEDRVWSWGEGRTNEPTAE